jgi:hypothetical protein
MIKSATEAGSIPTFHYMDEIEMDGLLAARALLKTDDALAGVRTNQATRQSPLPPGKCCRTGLVAVGVLLAACAVAEHVSGLSG